MENNKNCSVAGCTNTLGAYNKTGMQDELQKHFAEIGACREFQEWSTGLTPKQAWDTCTRPDWLLWWAGHTIVNKAGDLLRCTATITRTVPLNSEWVHLNNEWDTNPNAYETFAAMYAAYAVYAVERAATGVVERAAFASYAVAYTAAYIHEREGAAAAGAAAADAAYAKCCKIIRETLKNPFKQPKAVLVPLTTLRMHADPELKR